MSGHVLVITIVVGPKLLAALCAMAAALVTGGATWCVLAALDALTGKAEGPGEEDTLYWSEDGND